MHPTTHTQKKQLNIPQKGPESLCMKIQQANTHISVQQLQTADSLQIIYDVTIIIDS